MKHKWRRSEILGSARDSVGGSSMFKELVVPLALIMILGSMLLPLPPAMLDLLLVANLILALLLLVSALYIPDSLRLSSLPTMLLLATLYRLALNVATTRAILGKGEAGQVVEAFGHVLIGDNLIVGAVIFLMITLIQFIVIAKGSERVAEVAARFTLDALPGKQMSIDADVRAGLIDFETARKRRLEMQVESRFYGALDGAMKFIKGDSIAGLVITVINVVGGFATGLLIEGLEIERAVSKYTLLTVGDGMLSQIPALLNALAAGLVVTRVTKGEENSLANELVNQIGQVRKARLIIAVISILFGFVPGMPALPFICLSVVLVIGELFLATTNKPESVLPEIVFTPKSPPLIQIEMGERIVLALQTRQALLCQLQSFRKDVYSRFGLILPLPEVLPIREEVKRIRIRVRGIAAKEIVSDGVDLETLKQKMSTELLSIVDSRAGEFVDDVMTRRILDQFDKESPELVSAVVPGVLSVTQLTEIIRGLIREGVPINNFDLILQAVAENAGRTPIVPRHILEDVRIALKHTISCIYMDRDARVRAYILDPVIDLALADTERKGAPFEPSLIEYVVEYICQEGIEDRVILCSKSSRNLLRECLGLRKINIPVLAHEELGDEVSVMEVGRILLPEIEMEERLVASLAA